MQRTFEPNWPMKHTSGSCHCLVNKTRVPDSRVWGVGAHGTPRPGATRACAALHAATMTLALISACARPAEPSATRPSQPPTTLTAARAPVQPTPKSTLTVALVVDQLAAWVANDRLGRLPATGGFARLRNEGTWFKDVRFAHAVTDTAPGHASLYSGKTPREHGIVANEIWIDGHAVGIVSDATTRTLVAAGEQPEYSVSATAIKVDVVADRFKTRVPQGKVYSFSLKDRGAIFGGGRHPDLSLWYDAKLGQMVSSTAFAQRFPDWVMPALGQAAIKPRLDTIWMPSNPAGNELIPLTNDDQPGESDYAQYGAKFPHQPSHSTQPFAAFRANPDADRMLLELGLLAIDNSPKESPTLLAISLSANDYIGHLFGPDSWEANDELLRLDASLAWFFSEIDRRRGPSNWNTALSADHGVVPLPEVSRLEAKSFHEAGSRGSRPVELTGRVLTGELQKSVNKAANKAVGKGNWVVAFLDPYLYFSDDARHLPADRLDRLRSAVTEALAKVPGVARVFDISALPASCPPEADESLDALVCRSVQPGRGGEYYVALEPGFFFDTGYATGTGTSHGNAELADRSVPVLVRAPGKVEAGKVETAPQSFELFAHQLENLLDLR